MKRFKWKVLFLGIALLVLIGGIAGCSPQNLDDSAVQYGPMQDRSVHYPLTVKDQTGNLVQIEKEPQRIVSLMPSNTELLFALGAGKQVVGVTDQDDYPEEVKNLPKVSAFQINAEQVVALKPDLVVASSGNEKEVLDQLKKMGIPVLVADPQSTKEIYGRHCHLVAGNQSSKRGGSIGCQNGKTIADGLCQGGSSSGRKTGESVD